MTMQKQPHELQKTIKTACNRKIVVTHKAFEHLQAHPDVTEVLPEAIGKARVPFGDFVEMEIDLGRVIGKQSRVNTPLCDVKTQTLFAMRKGRDKPSRVAPPGTVADETTSVAVLARKSRDDPQTYLLVTAWIGSLARKEPWDPMIKSEAEYLECLEFWCSHALIHDPIVMGEAFTSTWEEVIDHPRKFI